MNVAPLPKNKTAKLNALRNLEILDTTEEAEFKKITAFAAQQFKVPIAVINLVGADHQRFRYHYGIDACETYRDVAFCAHAILQNDTFIIPDATQDPRFDNDPLVTGEPYIRFYAGHPLTSKDGFNIGTLCLIDTVPRTLTPKEQKLLAEMAKRVTILIQMRLTTMKLKNTALTLKSSQDKKIL
jgi:GAF domain-containing protein